MNPEKKQKAPAGEGRDSLLRRARTCATATAVSLGLTGGLFMLSPLVNYDPRRGSRKSGLIASGVLWVLILLSFLLYRRTGKAVAALEEEYPGIKRRNGRPGILCMNKTPAGWVADMGMAVSALFYLLSLLKLIQLPYYYRMLPFSLLTIFVLLHSFFNGKDFTRLYRITLRAKKRGERGKHP